jgi:uncharacterized CHY-type Zn-finger protein
VPRWEALKKKILDEDHMLRYSTNHDIVTLRCDDGDTYKANGQCLKLLHEPNPQDFEEVDVLNFVELE